MKRWYWHRYHTTLAHRMVFATIPRLPRFLHPSIAVVTAAIFFLLLRRERLAVAGNFRQVARLSGLRLWWKVGTRLLLVLRLHRFLLLRSTR